MQNYIVICEGVTDCSLVEAILEKSMGFKQFCKKSELPVLFQQMIRPYPNVLGELQRMDSPVFYHKGNVCAAVKQANGCTRIPEVVSAYLEIVSKEDIYDELGGFLIICDTDTKSQSDMRTYYKSCFDDRGISYQDGEIGYEGQRIGCKMQFIPEKGQGAVEKLLLECADVSYKEVGLKAQEFKDKIMKPEFDKIRKECWASDGRIQEFYGDKVKFGAICAVLKPDRPVRFAIKDKLIRTQYLESMMDIPDFSSLHKFLLDNMV